MIISKKYDEVSPVLNRDGLVGRKIYVNESAEAVHIKFDKGAYLQKHTTPVDVFFYILEGNAEIEIGDEIVNAEKDFIVESSKDIPHGIRNVGVGILRVLVVKAPKP